MIRQIVLSLTLAIFLIGCAQPEPDVSKSVTGSAAVTNPSTIACRFTPPDVPASMKAGEQIGIRIGVTNTGKETWLAGGKFPVRLGYHWADPSKRGNWDSVVWDDGNRGDLPADVAPGGKVWIRLTVKALPYRTTKAKLVIAPLMENVGWATANYVTTVDIE